MSLPSLLSVSLVIFFFFFKQKTAYEMRISDWSSDVCSSDLSQDGYARKYLKIGGFAHTRPARSRSGAAASGWPYCSAGTRPRSEERRGGKEGVSTCRSRWSP